MGMGQGGYHPIFKRVAGEVTLHRPEGKGENHMAIGTELLVENKSTCKGPATHTSLRNSKRPVLLIQRTQAFRWSESRVLGSHCK